VDVVDDCTARGDRPAENIFARAEANGLHFLAMTDHAEWKGWTDLQTGLTTSIWDGTRELIRRQEDGPTVGILGYEWTSCESDDYSGSHRTILLEDPGACEAWRVPGCAKDDYTSSPKETLARERYEPRGFAAPKPEVLAYALSLAAGEEGCADSRVVGFFHHVAYTRPGSVDWTDTRNADFGDSVVEIASEHGVSECADLSAPHCQFQVNAEFYDPAGSVQAALQLGHRLGFVGGTDSHDADPGSVANGPGAAAIDFDSDGDGVKDHVGWQFAPGALTAVLTTTTSPDRATILDAIDSRHTVAATWPFVTRIEAVGVDGVRYLPGDDVPASASPLRLLVEHAGDDAVVEVLEPWGSSEETLEVALAPGDVRYVRVRAWVDGVEVRAWASPFFGV
jgi:hypothetical protein